MINYFAYGSNMNKEDLDNWCIREGYPIVEYLSISPAKLCGYKLSFNYFSERRNGGAANIMESDREDCVYGLLIQLRDIDIETIRKKEGNKTCYGEIKVEVEKFDGTLVKNVKTYKVLKSREKSCHVAPKREYMQLIIDSAQKYNFPNEYIQFLESIMTKK